MEQERYRRLLACSPARRDHRGRPSDNRELMARSSADGPAWKSIIAAPSSTPTLSPRLSPSLARPMSTTFTEVFANL